MADRQSTTRKSSIRPQDLGTRQQRNEWIEWHIVDLGQDLSPAETLTMMASDFAALEDLFTGR